MSTFTDWNGPQGGGVRAADLIQLANAYSDLVDYCFDHNGIEVNAPIYQQCQTALIALMAYACENENEDKFEEWINKYKNQKKFSPSQKVNYDFLKRSFDKMANV